MGRLLDQTIKSTAIITSLSVLFNCFKEAKFLIQRGIMDQQDVQKYNDDVLSLSQMFNLPLPQAFTLLRQSHYSLEQTVNRLLSNTEPAVLPLDASIASSPEKRTGRRQKFHGASERSRVLQFRKTYLIRKPKSKAKGRRQSKRKGASQVEADSQSRIDEEFDFKQKLGALLGAEPALSLFAELYEVFEVMEREKKLVALHCLPLSQEVVNDKVLKLYQLKEFVAAFNKSFLNLGLDPSKTDFTHYPFLSDLVNPQTDTCVIVLLRLNQVSLRVQVLRKLQITEVFDPADPDGIKITVDGIVRQSHRVGQSEAAGVRPVSEGERRKIQADRVLRQQQELQYLQNLAAEADNKNRAVAQEEDIRRQQEHLQEAAQRRAAMRETLMRYQGLEGGVQFKVRLPSSQILQVSLPPSERISYLFNLVQSHQGDLGFDDELRREFDLLLPYERTSLGNRRDQSVEAVFGAELKVVVVVKECGQ